MLHMPFLFWLIDTSRPTRIVQAGIGEPARFLSLCQAAEKLGMESLCIGIDDSMDGHGLSEDQASEHAALYGDFSFVARESLASAVRHLHGEAVDLLVIDTALDNDHIEALKTHWVPLLSPRALIAIHDPENTLGDAARIFVTELAKGKDIVAFPQATPDLHLILAGDIQPEKLRQLAALELGMPGYLVAQQIFIRLGQGLESAQALRRAQRTIEEAAASRRALEDQLVEVKAELEAEQAAKQLIASSEAQQISRVVELQANLFDMQSNVRELSLKTLSAEEEGRLRDALSLARDERDQALQQHEMAQHAIEDNQGRHDAAMAAAAMKRRELEQTILLLQQEVATMVEDHEALVADQCAKLTASTEQCDHLLTALAAAQASIAHMETQYAEAKGQLLNSPLAQDMGTDTIEEM